MLKLFEIGSAPIDWCERNYAVSGFIAEFFNTISNILFFILPPILIYLFLPYGKKFMQSIHIVWILLVVVGICSTYFHATLSLAGQLLDELAILWVIHVGFALWFPKRLFPSIFQNNRNYFQWLIFVIGVLSTCLACVNPAVNAFVLMCFGIPATILLIIELKRCDCRKVYKLGKRSSLLWGLALTSWILDRSLCHPYLSKSFPYLHSLWHVLILLATYGACVLFAYFHAKHEAPSDLGMPVLRYWPSSSGGISKMDFMNVDGHRSHKINHESFMKFRYPLSQFKYLNKMASLWRKISSSEIGRVPYVTFVSSLLPPFSVKCCESNGAIKNRNHQALDFHTYNSESGIRFNACDLKKHLGSYRFYYLDIIMGSN
ncbi:unnamed protein product [Gordionus sp. m RMFG-2023]